jgi:hypothetical protein
MKLGEPMLLIVSAILAVVPLLGIVWVLLNRSITTVDGLFLSLILLAISGIFALNAGWEFQRHRRRAAWLKQHPEAARQLVAISDKEVAGILRGRVEKVQFYEANVGQPNKSVVYISNGSGAPRMIVLEGDLRNRLPAGKRVEISFREDNGRRQLLSANYA